MLKWEEKHDAYHLSSERREAHERNTEKLMISTASDWEGEALQRDLTSHSLRLFKILDFLGRESKLAEHLIGVLTKCWRWHSVVDLRL